MTCPNCKNEDTVQRGYKNGYDVSWCVHCGQIRWCSDGLIPASAQGRDDHAEWCADHLGLVAFGCAGEANKQKLWLDPTQTACKSWCGHHRYCSTGPNLAYVEPGDIEYASWTPPRQVAHSSQAQGELSVGPVVTNNGRMNEEN